MDRRNFIKKSILGGVMPQLGENFYPKFMGNTLFETALQTVDKANDHVLVLIQMTGGNDGLNTIFPMETYGNLWLSRLSVVVPSEHILPSKFSERVSFHPSMKGVRDLFDEQKVRIINSVGYPNQNYSHFKSTDIWMTGSEASQSLRNGWMGRYLDTEFVGYPNSITDYSAPPAIVTNTTSQLVLQGNFNYGISVYDPSSVSNTKPSFSNFKVSGNALNELNFLKLSDKLSKGYSTEIYNRVQNVTRQKEYPNTSLASQLKNIARMIASGLKTKVYLANISGFDTHANQVVKDTAWEGIHANLLKEVSEGISAFMEDLKFLGIEKRVVGLTFSEFGRRVGANGSFGTDHGAAAPMIAFGEQVLGGIAGDNPTIEKTADFYTNLPMLHDFRSVFSSVLKDWFCVKQSVLEEVFLKNFQYIPIVANFDCLGVTGNESNSPIGENLVNNNKPDDNISAVKITATEKTIGNDSKLICYPNPFHEKLTIEFESEGGYCQVQIYNSLGQLLSNINEGNFSKGFYKVQIGTEYFSNGAYFVRFQNKSYSKTFNLMRMS